MSQITPLLTKQGKTSKQIASSLVIMRNSIKMETRALMAADGFAGLFMKKVLEIRNKHHYGNSLGPNMAWYTSKGKSADDIIKSALKSNDKVNRLVGGTL